MKKRASTAPLEEKKKGRKKSARKKNVSIIIKWDKLY